MLQATDGTRVLWVTTAIARRMLGVSRQRVHQLIKEGRLRSTKVHGSLMVATRSIEARINGQEEMFDEL
jgi:excisionase family DNA binding protein